MGGGSPFRKYSSYLRETYGETVYRVGIDAGFGCPNRCADGSGGCAYCDGEGSRATYLGFRIDNEGGRDQAFNPNNGFPAYDRKAVADEIGRASAFLKTRYGARKFMLYFQAFSSTFASLDTLKKIYGESLALADFVGFIVSTRPDCLKPGVPELLASYRDPDSSPPFEVWVELGLQSAQDSTLSRIGRGHAWADFEEAFQRLKRLGLKVAVHLIFGLPGETQGIMLDTVSRLAALSPDGVKIHDLHIPHGSGLLEEFMAGELSLPCPARYGEMVIRALELLPPETLIMRLSCDTPKDRRAMPRRQIEKAAIYREIEAEMKARGTKQGRLFRG